MFLIKLLGHMGHRQVSRLHGTKVDMYLDYMGQRQISAANNFSNSPRNSSTSVFSLELKLSVKSKIVVFEEVIIVIVPPGNDQVLTIL